MGAIRLTNFADWSWHRREVAKGVSNMKDRQWPACWVKLRHAGRRAAPDLRKAKEEEAGKRRAMSRERGPGKGAIILGICSHVLFWECRRTQLPALTIPFGWR